MSSAKHISSEPLRRHRLSVEDYYRMGEAGIFNEQDRVELIEGEILDMVPIGSNHAYTLNKIVNQFLMRHLSSDVIARIQDPLRLDQYNEPEPDIALVANKNYSARHPGAADTMLVVEVADSSLAYDLNIKIPLYARHNIPEAWIIDLIHKSVHVFSGPENGASLSPLHGLRDIGTSCMSYQVRKEVRTGKLIPADILSFVLDLDVLWKN